MTAAWAQTRMPRFRWENFTTENGLPDNHVFQVKVDGDRVWAATENGLALYQNGRWKVYGTQTGWRTAPSCSWTWIRGRETYGRPPWAV